MLVNIEIDSQNTPLGCNRYTVKKRKNNVNIEICDSKPACFATKHCDYETDLFLSMNIDDRVLALISNVWIKE